MPRRILMGTVVSDKADKTLSVKVERRYSDPLFKKTVRSSKNYKTHDEQNKYKIGDLISINILRDKRFITFNDIPLKIFPVPIDKMYGGRAQLNPLAPPMNQDKK